jgi:hypothetical protein
VPPYVALHKPDEVTPPETETIFNVKTEIDIHDDLSDDDDDDDDEDEDNVDDPETESKPKYLPPIFGNHVLRPAGAIHPATSATLITGFPHPDNGAVVRPLPPEIALRLQLDFGQVEAARQKPSPSQHVAESSNGSPGSR